MGKIKTITDYFKTNEEVFVQNVSGGVVSMTFYYDDGRSEPFTLPNDRRPVCITDLIPIEIVRKSADIRKLAQRQPPAILLLTREEYEETVNRIAKESGKTVEEVVDGAREAVYLAQSKPTPTTSEIGEDSNLNEDTSSGVRTADIDVPGIVEDNVEPRVIQIVSSCSPESQVRMNAQEAIEQLSLLNLKSVDLEYIIGNCAWRTVVAWAQKKRDEISSSK